MSETTLDLFYRAPYDWERIIAFLEMRAIPGAELVSGGAYLRTARIEHDGRETLGWLSVEHDPERESLRLRISAELAPVAEEIAQRVRRQFDLDCDPAAVSAGLAAFDEACPNAYAPGLRVPGCFDPYEMSVRAILGQQISVKGASTLAGRIARVAGTPVETGVDGLTHAFPGPAQILALPDAAEALGSLGIIGRRVKTIVALAEGLATGALDLSYGADPESVTAALEAMPGIGPWTAQYIAMRTIGFTDAFPATDLGVKKALSPRSPKEIEAVSQAWRPWRAYATLSLWTSPH